MRCFKLYFLLLILILLCPSFVYAEQMKAADFIKKIATDAGGNPSSTSVIGSTGLAYDGTSDNNLRYTGKTVNNYVRFSDDSEKTWRIIGVFGDSVKLIDTTKYLNHMFDDDLNTWNDSEVKTFLNTTVYDDLSPMTKSLIDDHIWYLGSLSNANVTRDVLYQNERGANSFGDPNTWIGKIGLIYPSDYAFASNVHDSASTPVQQFDVPCMEEDWLDPGNEVWEWYISPRSSNHAYSFFHYAFGVTVYFTQVYNQALVRPSFYLNQDAYISTGTGTYEDPYIIKYVTYNKVTINKSKNSDKEIKGTINITTEDIESVENNTPVTFTVVPDEGYEVKDIEIVDETSTYIDYSKTENQNEYVFLMPETSVDISAEFQEIQNPLTNNYLVVVVGLIFISIVVFVFQWKANRKVW